MVVNIGQINAPSAPSSIGAVTLAELRQRLRVQLSNYVANSLISNTNPDTEKQFINDAIGQLWPYDFQVCLESTPIIPAARRYYLSTDLEHVFEVSISDKDIDDPTADFQVLPFFDCWTFETAYVENSTPSLTWINQTRRILNIRDLGVIGQTSSSTTVIRPSYLIIRGARRWGTLEREVDSIEPSPQRIQAVVHFAAASFFNSQLEVNTESIRLRNYQSNATTELQLAMSNLSKDPKTLWMH